MPDDGYGQFCPVAKAAEVIDQRWTVLVLRELVAGSSRFNDIHRGVPRMSRTLLARRLRQLAAGGIVARKEGADGPEYELTEAGSQFRSIIDALGHWGIRWLDSLADADFDPAFLLWDMRRKVNTSALPDHRIVLEINFRDLPGELRNWWLVLQQSQVDVCQHDPGFGIDVTLKTEIRAFIRVWRGDVAWADAARDGELEVVGPRALRQAVPDWFRDRPFLSSARSAR
nr:helix-turn-helix domain-containing protein [Hoyosella altamirensis]